MSDSYCLECDTKIIIGKDPKEGQIITCPSCGSDLMIVGVSPIVLDWTYDDDEYIEDEEYELED
jgi:DNA-directed RNA polymerase subunit RPC12/RpoP